MGGSVGPRLLWSRALILGLLASALGTVGHVAADGGLPGPGTLITLNVVMVGLSALVLLRPASSWLITAALAGGQALVHLVLSSAAGHAVSSEMPSGHDGHMQMAGGGDGSIRAVADQITAHVAGHGPMMAAHLAAAALLGLWLGRGELALWTLIALAVRRIIATVPGLAVLETRPRHLTTPAPGPLGPRSPWQSLPHARRGPPLAAVS